MRIDRVLDEYGLLLKPMHLAPHDGRPIIVFSNHERPKICRWTDTPKDLAGPAWVEQDNDGRGYLDRYFFGWIDVGALLPLDEAGVRRLLIAYIDEARESGDAEPLNVRAGLVRDQQAF